MLQLIEDTAQTQLDAATTCTIPSGTAESHPESLKRLRLEREIWLRLRGDRTRGERSQRVIAITAADVTDDQAFRQTESPFDQFDEAKSADAKIREISSFIRTLNHIPFADDLASRIEFLAEAGAEEGTPLSLESVRNFLAFLESWPTLRYPSLVLSPAGYLEAVWRDAPNRILSLQFLENGQVRFVLFAPNTLDQSVTDRVYGITVWQALAGKLLPYQPFWVVREG